MKSPEKKKLATASAFGFVCCRQALERFPIMEREIDAIGNHGYRVAEAESANRIRFGRIERPDTSCATEVTAFKETQGDFLFPAGILHGPLVEHPVGMNHV